MPNFSTFTLDDADASDLVELLGEIKLEALSDARIELCERVQAKVTEGRYIAKTDRLEVHCDFERVALTARLAHSQAYALNERLSDPHGYGSGRNSQVPTCDHYNELLGIVSQLVQ